VDGSWTVGTLATMERSSARKNVVCIALDTPRKHPWGPQQMVTGRVVWQPMEGRQG
jgi:hypothetical protein